MRGSCTSPWSTAILRSLWAGRQGWTIFYLETGVGITAAAESFDVAVPQSERGDGLDHSLRPADPDLYARLLGRLGWYLQVQIRL